MPTSDEFETSLRKLCSGRTGVGLEIEGDLLSKLRQASGRLRKDRTLLRGDRTRDFTYDDPVLAVALFGFKQGIRTAQGIVHLAEGEALSKKEWLKWGWTGVRLAFQRITGTLESLAGRVPLAPVTLTAETLRLAVTGDAGFRGAAQDAVIRLIRDGQKRQRLDAVIHLGDVYFAAGIEEMIQNFVAPFSILRNGGIRLFTLVGNHDVYYGGAALEATFDILRQPGRYFVVKTPHWNVICLDTSLPDQTLRRGEGDLDRAQLAWLDDLLDSNQNPAVLLTHHYYVSAWGDHGKSLRARLKRRLKDRVLAWYWGHEHVAAAYPQHEDGFFGACIGNGAFLEKWRRPKRPKKPSSGLYANPVWYADTPCRCFEPDGTDYWPHGYLELELRPQKIFERYFLEGNSLEPAFSREIGV